jgi:hypothetical protein
MTRLRRIESSTYIQDARSLPSIARSARVSLRLHNALRMHRYLPFALTSPPLTRWARSGPSSPRPVASHVLPSLSSFRPVVSSFSFSSLAALSPGSFLSSFGPKNALHPFPARKPLLLAASGRGHRFSRRSSSPSLSRRHLPLRLSHISGSPFVSSASTNTMASSFAPETLYRPPVTLSLPSPSLTLLSTALLLCPPAL